ncbi:hypothetical protein [Microbacterium excoecariae]|nr:hypothetical protein [Microbacterium excoecariae]
MSERYVVYTSRGELGIRTNDEDKAARTASEWGGTYEDQEEQS